MEAHRWVAVTYSSYVPATDEVAVLYDAEQLIKTAPGQMPPPLPTARSPVRLAGMQVVATAYSLRRHGFYRKVRPPKRLRLHREQRAEASYGGREVLQLVPVLSVEVIDDDDALELGADADTELLLLHYRVGPDGPIPPDDVCLHADLAEMLVEKQVRAPTRSPGLGGFGADGEPVTEPTLAELDAAFALEQSKEVVPPLHLSEDRILQPPNYAKLDVAARPAEVATDDVELGAFLGTGGFGDAFEASWRGERVVAKLLPTEEDEDASDAAASAPAAALSAIALALADVRHAHLIRVLGCRTEPPRRFVVVERAPLGSLHDVVHNGKVRALSPAIQAAVLRDAARGMAHLHAHAALHLNLRSANLMVFDHLHIKVSDARLRPAWAALGSKARRAEVAAWCAPELLIATSGEGYDRPMLGGASSERRRASDTLHPVSAKCDVYSFAMTAYEVILREKPFAGISDVRWLAVESRDRPPVPLPLERDEAAAPLIALMKRCWAHFPAERPTFVAICTELEARVAADEDASNEVRDDDPTRTLSFQRDQLLRSRAAVGPPDPPARRASAAGRRASAAGRRASAATATGATDGAARWRRGVGKLEGAAALAAATRTAPAAAARAERDGTEPSAAVAADEAAAAGGGSAQEEEGAGGGRSSRRRRRRRRRALAPGAGRRRRSWPSGGAARRRGRPRRPSCSVSRASCRPTRRPSSGASILRMRSLPPPQALTAAHAERARSPSPAAPPPPRARAAPAYARRRRRGARPRAAA